MRNLSADLTFDKVLKTKATNGRYASDPAAVQTSIGFFEMFFQAWQAFNHMK